MLLTPCKGTLVRVAQDSPLCEYSKEEHTMYWRTTSETNILAIFVRKFSEYNDEMCELIIGDKILYAPQKDLREVKNKREKND